MVFLIEFKKIYGWEPTVTKSVIRQEMTGKSASIIR